MLTMINHPKDVATLERFNLDADKPSKIPHRFVFFSLVYRAEPQSTKLDMAKTLVTVATSSLFYRRSKILWLNKTRKKLEEPKRSGRHQRNSVGINSANRVSQRAKKT